VKVVVAGRWWAVVACRWVHHLWQAFKAGGRCGTVSSVRREVPYPKPTKLGKRVVLCYGR